MKHTLFLSMMAAVFLGSGVVHAGTFYASDYERGGITVGTEMVCMCDTLVVNAPLTLTGDDVWIDLYDGSTIEFHADNSGAICRICFTTASHHNIFFHEKGTVYNFTFNDGAQAIAAASAGTPITLIEDLSKAGGIMFFNTTPAQTTLTLNGKEAGESVEMNGVQFTYVGPKEDTYVFQEGQIGFTGYYRGSHALNLVANAPAVPEPTTGTLSLLALAGLAVRRRRK